MGISKHIAPHSRGKKKKDKIFYYGGLAKQAIAKHGPDAVINATIGALLDEQSALALLPSVEEAGRRLETVAFAPYAPVAGTNEFRQDVIDYIYEGVENRPNLGSIATSGATGALRLAIWDFLEQGDAVVTHDYFWAPYRAITEDAGRELMTFETFEADNSFNVAGAIAATEQALAERDRTLLLINTPCHNPTGGSITGSEMGQLKKELDRICSENPDKNLTLLIDAAYWEFGDAEENRTLLETFVDLPENFVFCFAFTLSKSLTRYGLRTGALLFAAHDPQVVDDIAGVMTTSVRVHWSNTCHLGQRLFSEVFRDEGLRAQLKAEQKAFADVCNERGKIFVEEAVQVGLPHTPFAGGFFLTLPTPNPEPIANELCKENIFLVPLAKGVRVALCAIPTKKIPGLAKRIKAVFGEG